MIHLFNSFTVFSCSLILAMLFVQDASAQWCRACNIGTNFNQIKNCGTITPTTSRQIVTAASSTTNCTASSNHAMFWSFTATAGRTYVFDFGTMGVNSLTDNRIRIYDGPCASGNLVSATNGTTNTCDNNGYTEWTCTVSGTYYVLATYSSCAGNFSECLHVRLGYYYLELTVGCTSTTYFDPGGAGGSGTNRNTAGNYFRAFTGQNGVWARTYVPANAANKVNITFTSFATEVGNDLLYIYDGPSTASPQVAGSPFSGNALPGGALGITSTAAGGELTVRFVTDGGLSTGLVVGAGWNANVSAGAPVIAAGGNHTICSGQNTTLNGSGTGPFNWAPSTGLSCTTCPNPIANPTISTSYTLSATNACGTATDVAIVTVNPSPTANAGPNRTICANQNTTLTGSGIGNYNWSPSTGLSCTTCSSPVASPPANTTYTLTTSNACGSSTSTVSVTVNTLPSANAGGNQTICNGQSATLNGTGGGNYNWLPSSGLSCTNCPNPVASPTASTTYTVTVTDGNGCTASNAAAITVNPLPTANAGPDRTICSGQSTTLNGGGSGTYNWSPSSGLSCTTCANPVASPTANTTYTLSSSNGCGSVTDVAVVNVNPLPSASAGGNQTICAGSSATLNASGGGTYNWSPSSGLSCTTCANPVTSVTTNTNYTVTVTDGNGCTASAATALTVNPLPDPNISGSQTICAGDIATLTATGGGTYLWNTGSTSATITDNPTATTTYTVTITDANGCTNSTTSTVNVTTLPSASITGSSATVCNGSAVTLTASGGGTYLWNTGSTDAIITDNPTANTTYTVTVSSGSCSSFTTATVNVNPLPSAAVAGNMNICLGETTTLTASGGTTYLWSNNSTSASITVNPTASTTYTVVVADVNGCSDTATATVNVAPPPTALVTGNTTICAGQSALLTASGGLTYSWNTGATASAINVSPTLNTSYTVVVAAGNCTDTASIAVTVNPLPVVNISGNNAICSGQTATLTATGGGTYLWNNGMTTNVISVSPTANTNYTVTVTGANGCTAVATSSVTVTPSPVALISAGATICAGSSAVLTASGGTGYSWNTGQTTSSINASAAGTYSVWVSNGGCMDSASTSVMVNPNPTANAGTNVTVSYGNSTTLGASGGGTYSWNTGDLTSVITVQPTQTTTYCVYVTDSNGCGDTACVTVFVEFDCGEFFIPNAFSPNADGKNDILYVRSKCLKSMHFVIYDRWGGRVFETEDITKGWDGMRNGKMENAAVFNYILNYELLNGDRGEKKGTINLVR